MMHCRDAVSHGQQLQMQACNRCRASCKWDDWPGSPGDNVAIDSHIRARLRLPYLIARNRHSPGYRQASAATVN